MRTRLAAIVAALAAAAAPVSGQDGRAEAARKLSSLRVTVDFQNVTLNEAVDYLREISGLNMVVSTKVAEKHPDLRVTLKVRDLTVKSALKLMLQGRDLVAVYRDGALVVLPQEDHRAHTEIRMYDVRAQLNKIQDFPGPKMELVSPGGKNTGPVVGIDLFEAPEPPIGADLLVTLVKENTGGRSWEAGEANIELVNGRMVVSQSRPVHREIEQFLKLLEQYK